MLRILWFIFLMGSVAAENYEWGQRQQGDKLIARYRVEREYSLFWSGKIETYYPHDYVSIIVFNLILELTVILLISEY